MCRHPRKICFWEREKLIKIGLVTRRSAKWFPACTASQVATTTSQPFLGTSLNLSHHETFKKFNSELIPFFNEFLSYYFKLNFYYEPFTGVIQNWLIPLFVIDWHKILLSIFSQVLNKLQANFQLKLISLSFDVAEIKTAEMYFS